jgi:hypothetical protein
MADTVQSLEDSLARLEKLQTQVRHPFTATTNTTSSNPLTTIQLDALRATIPNLVSPLIKPQSSKAHMFAEVKKTAVTSTSQLTAFRDDWNSEQTQQIFTKAQASEQKDRDLSKAQEVAAFGWAEKTVTES